MSPSLMESLVSSPKTWFVTGGAGFIGSNFVLKARKSGWARIVNLDLLTYAGNRQSLLPLAGDSEHEFVRGDICDPELVANLLTRH